MTPDEIINKLLDLNVKMTRRTLLNYEKWNLIPFPNRSGKGRGRGRYTDYPEITLFFAYVAHRLMHDELQLRPETVAQMKNDFVSAALASEKDEDWEKYVGKLEHRPLNNVLLAKWFYIYWEAAENGIPAGGRVMLIDETTDTLTHINEYAKKGLFWDGTIARKGDSYRTEATMTTTWMWWDNELCWQVQEN